MDTANNLDEATRQQLTRLANNRRDDAAGLRRAVADLEPWQWDIGKLVRRDTEAYLYQRALDHSPEAAASMAISLILDTLSAGGSSDPHDRAIRDSKAHAAIEVVRTMAGLGVSEETIGAMLIGNRR